MKVALLSDVHANLVALRAVLEVLPPVDAIWVTGDTVGYGPEPSDTLALLQERGAVLIAGNHDRAVATGRGLDLFNSVAADAARIHQRMLSPAERDVLGGLPETLVLLGIGLCHGSFRDPLWEYVFTAPVAAASLAAGGTAFGCCGHTHVPALWAPDAGGTIAGLRPEPGHPYALGATALLNPGSVGQPRDGDPRAAYGVLDTAARTVTFERVAYDVQATRRRIHDRKLPEVLGDRLVHGL